MDHLQTANQCSRVTQTAYFLLKADDRGSKYPAYLSHILEQVFSEMRSQYSADFLAERPLLFLLRVFNLKQKTWKLPQACQQTCSPPRQIYLLLPFFLCVSESSCTMTETSTKIIACIQTNASLLTLTVFSVIQAV